MTPYERDLIEALDACSIFQATRAARFVRDLAGVARLEPDRTVSVRERALLEILAWRFRRQMPERFVPERRPPDLPKRPRVARRRSPRAIQRTAARDAQARLPL